VASVPRAYLIVIDACSGDTRTLLNVCQRIRISSSSPTFRFVASASRALPRTTSGMSAPRNCGAQHLLPTTPAIHLVLNALAGVLTSATMNADLGTPPVTADAAIILHGRQDLFVAT
jgi:hypothetical protein